MSCSVRWRVEFDQGLAFLTRSPPEPDKRFVMFGTIGV